MVKKYKGIGIVILVAIIGLYAIYSYINGGEKNLNKNNTESIFVDEKEKIVNTSKEIVVEIKGEVKNPNIYWMKEESIIQDIINEAGGLTGEADISSINRAEQLNNHQSIIIPNKNSVVISEGNGQNKEGKININTASESELDSLPGIGKSRAESIIKYREEKGGFKSIEEIKNINGIGDAAFEKLKEKITI
ncbi:MAG: competence protein ComEA [Clostridiales bacterium]|nr:competence protein ComEA [Clostridiales bacterium]